MKIYTIGKNDDVIINELDFGKIEMPIISTDNEIHDFIETNLLNLDFNALIITVTKVDTTTMFRLALHIRLTEKLWYKRLCPVLFVSTESLGTILRDAGIYGHILATKGCRFEQLKSIEIIGKAIEKVEPLTPDDFKVSFLKQISIQPDETIGRHSIANQWGALILDKVANTKVLNSNRELLDTQKKLYFKYVSALNFDYSKLSKPQKKLIDLEQFNKSVTIDSAGYKILLIDDEAEKGWQNVLEKVFKNSDKFDTISEKIKDFDGLSSSSKNIIENEEYDLFLIDLRLNGIDEEGVIEPKDFSGTKILKKIKEINRGNQVIIFTASNKAWNLKALLDLEQGADGYYIKESPEYNFPLSFSKENYSNFQNEVRKCLKLNYLREIFDVGKKCNDFINVDKPNRSIYYKSFYERSAASLEIAFELLKKSANDLKYLNLAYLTYFQILEDYVGQHENFRFDYNSGNAYVNSNVLVIDGNTKEWQLKFIKKGIEKYDYFEAGTEINDKNWSSLSQISFALIFKFNKNNAYLQNWGKLNHLRNTKAGHGGNGGFVTIQEIKELLETVELFLTNQ